MLELKLTKESLFVNALEAILDLTDVASVVCTSKGLKLRAVDTERVAVIELFLPPECFDYYHCDGCISMGIPIDNMLEAIHCADDTITMKIGDYNIFTMTLSFEPPKKNNTTASRLLDASYEMYLVEANHITILDWQVLEPNYHAFVQMPSADFMRVCEDFSNIGGDGHISVTKKGVKFFACGKGGRFNIKYMERDTIVTVQASVSATLYLKCMNSLAKVFTLSNQVKIRLSIMHPLIVECNVGETGYIRYFITQKDKIEIKKRKISKRNNNDEGSAKEKERSEEIEE